jgi:hypothetical protein
VAAGRTDTFLGERYRRIARRRGANKAIVAVGRPSWSSSGTCWPTPTPASVTSAPASTTPASTRSAPSATTSASSKPWAARSPSNPPPDPAPIHPAWTRLRCAAPVLPPARSHGFSDQDEVKRSASRQRTPAWSWRGAWQVTAAFGLPARRPSCSPADRQRGGSQPVSCHAPFTVVGVVRVGRIRDCRLVLCSWRMRPASACWAERCIRPSACGKGAVREAHSDVDW